MSSYVYRAWLGYRRQFLLGETRKIGKIKVTRSTKLEVIKKLGKRETLQEVWL